MNNPTFGQLLLVVDNTNSLHLGDIVTFVEVSSDSPILWKVWNKRLNSAECYYRSRFKILDIKISEENISDVTNIINL